MISSGKNIGASSGNAPMSEINTTPLVDVMLVLLVIFIITAPLMTHAVRIDLPKASSQLLNEKPEVISISIDHSGKMYWNEMAINPADAKTKLEAAAKRNPQPEVHIRADKDTRYQVLAEIMANAQTAGITKLGFVSEPK
jgi:biopolymer transport protein ExbD